jgi:hypothetical protein
MKCLKCLLIDLTQDRDQLRTLYDHGNELSG